MGFKEGIWSFG